MLAEYLEGASDQKKEECFSTDWDLQILLVTMAEIRKLNAYLNNTKSNDDPLGYTAGTQRPTIGRTDAKCHNPQTVH